MGSRQVPALAPVFAGVKDQSPGQKDEHGMRQTARENERRDPDQEHQNGDDRTAREQDREGRDEDGEQVIHGINIGGLASGLRGGADISFGSRITRLVH